MRLAHQLPRWQLRQQNVSRLPTVAAEAELKLLLLRRRQPPVLAAAAAA